MDVKKPGDIVYVVGQSHEELGGIYFAMMGEQLEGKAYVGTRVPEVNAVEALTTYQALSESMERGLINSCHTPTIGGLEMHLPSRPWQVAFVLRLI